MTNHKHKQYLRTKIQTASKEELVLMLFDGAIRFCRQGSASLQAKDINGAYTSLTKAQEIIMELLYAVDRDQGGEIAENLVRLYSYSLVCLVEANMQRKPAKADEVQKIMRELREGWNGAMRKVKEQAACAGATGLEAANQAQARSRPSPDTVTLSSAPPHGKQQAPASGSKPVSPRKKPPTDNDLTTADAMSAVLQPRLSVQG